MKKRKYTRKTDAPESKISPIKEESRGNVSTQITFEGLPLSLRRQVEGIIEYRKKVGLPDDSEIRKERAVKYFVGDSPR